MIVDDNVSFLRAMVSMLERDGAHVVATASGGAEAVARAEEHRPDVVLLDVRLGSESGFDVARRIVTRAGVIAGWEPMIILVSTHPQNELADRIEANPSFGYLDKTVVSAEHIRNLLAR